MADLEKLLLEAAGRTGPSRRNRHSPPSPRRRRGGSYSDNESDSDDLHDNRGYASRKHSTSHVPLKKRLDSSGRDDEHSSRQDGDDGFDRQGDSDDDSIGSDLYKDEDDRRKLAQMTELEREMILSERSTKITDKKMQEKLRKQKEKMNQSRKDSHPHISSRTSVRTSARSSDRATAKDDALNELRAKRMRQKDPDTHQRFGDLTKGGSGSHRYSPVKRRSLPAKAASSSSQSGSGSQSEDDESSDDGGIGDSEDDKSSPESTVLKYDDIKEITIERSKLAKWLMEPFFDDLIVGCFVRVKIMSKTGPTYKLCVVRNVESENSGKQYKLDNKMTHKYLNAVWGNESSADRLQMDRVSDFPPTTMEFEQWVKEVERNVGRMPSKQDVLDKKDAIQKTSTYVYSAATVKQMVQEKKSATSSSRPLNVLAEKDRLRREMEVALGMKDGAEVERIKARLSELEASRQTQEKDKKAVMLAEMNRRNRVENFRNASGLKSTIGLKAGDAGYDPFSRRWTRSRNYYVPKAGGGGEAAVTENGDQTAELVVPDVGGAVSTAAALEAAADAGKLVDTSAPVDQGTESNMLHNFELPISLAILQKFGGAQGAQAGFMARKQRIEATIGCQVPENDGRRHGLTLTVSDYKRRRGLL